PQMPDGRFRRRQAPGLGASRAPRTGGYRRGAARLGAPFELDAVRLRAVPGRPDRRLALARTVAEGAAMSLVNDMLRDLEARRAAPAERERLSGLYAANETAAARRAGFRSE